MIDRRKFLRQSSVAVVAGGLSGAARTAFAAEAAIVRSTKQGPVRGSTAGSCTRFLGIPFAAPPVGALRFRAPQPALPRKDVLEATSFAAAPVQKDSPPGLYGPGPFPRSEDCLYLNVWAPTQPGPHPVYVWVHGGGNVAGSSRMPVFDGSKFADDGIVCVTISYRVGALGFLDLGEVLGPQYAGSGNNGLLDIVAALEWVRENIASFGGDPARVTLGGQSAGAKNVCTLMAMPAARGLFSAAIVESGGSQTAATAEVAAMMTRKFLDIAGLASDPSALLNLPSEKILEVQNRLIAQWSRKYPFRAVIDGHILPKLPLSALHADIPLMLGWARNDVAFFGPNAQHDGSVVQADLANMALADFTPVYEQYARVLPNLSPIDRRYAALSAEEYGIPSIRTAAAHAKAGGNAWLWRLDMPRAAEPHAGYAVHGSELPLVWDKVDDPLSSYLGPDGREGAALSHTMHTIWMNFIHRHKAPWPRYNAAIRPTMLFSAKSHVALKPDHAEVGLWDHAHFDFAEEPGLIPA